MGSVVEVPPDWYRSGFPPITAAMHWGHLMQLPTVPIRFGEVFEKYEEIPFRQRLHTAEERA